MPFNMILPRSNNVYAQNGPRYPALKADLLTNTDWDHPGPGKLLCKLRAVRKE